MGRWYVPASSRARCCSRRLLADFSLASLDAWDPSPKLTPSIAPGVDTEGKPRSPAGLSASLLSSNSWPVLLGGGGLFTRGCSGPPPSQNFHDPNRRCPEKEATYLDHHPLEEKVTYYRCRCPPLGSLDPAISSAGSGSGRHAGLARTFSYNGRGHRAGGRPLFAGNVRRLLISAVLHRPVDHSCST